VTEVRSQDKSSGIVLARGQSPSPAPLPRVPLDGAAGRLASGWTLVNLTVEPLAAHRDALPLLAAWFRREWPAWYGPGGPGDARKDLESYADGGSLPVGVVALQEGRVCGVAALRAESIASHRHLTPWAAAGLVDPALRGRGIGAALVAALEAEARAQGFRRVYCATATAESLLRRRAWTLLERVLHDGQDLGVYAKDL